MKAVAMETEDLRSIHRTHLVEREQIPTTCPLISKVCHGICPHTCNFKKFKRHYLPVHIKNSGIVHQEHTYMATKSQATDSKIRNRESKMATKRLTHL